MSDRPALASPSPVVVRHATGLPEGAEPPTDQQPYATWGDVGTLLVMTWGSSRCPRLPVSVELDGPHTVVVRSDLYRPGGPCTLDFVPTTAVLAVPDGLDESTVVTVRLDDVESGLAQR